MQSPPWGLHSTLAAPPSAPRSAAMAREPRLNDMSDEVLEMVFGHLGVLHM